MVIVQPHGLKPYFFGPARLKQDFSGLKGLNPDFVGSHGLNAVFFHLVWILIFHSMRSQAEFFRPHGLKLNISCSLRLKPVFGLSPDFFYQSILKLDFLGPGGLKANFVPQHGLKPDFFCPTGLNPALFGSNVLEPNIACSHGLKPDSFSPPVLNLSFFRSTRSEMVWIYLFVGQDGLNLDFYGSLHLKPACGLNPD